jgi:hypothetical protein
LGREGAQIEDEKDLQWIVPVKAYENPEADEGEKEGGGIDDHRLQPVMESSA